MIYNKMNSFLKQMIMMNSFAHTTTAININYALNAKHRDTPALGKYYSLPFCTFLFFPNLLLWSDFIDNNSILFMSSVPPSIRTTGPAERAVVLHKSISLECISNGIPPPSITWLKDSRPVDTTQGHLKVGSPYWLKRHTETQRLLDTGMKHNISSGRTLKSHLYWLIGISCHMLNSDWLIHNCVASNYPDD